MNTNKRIVECDFIRAICAIGIVLYHCSCYSLATEYYFLPPIENGDWGNILVTVFFILSGAMLYRNNAEITSVRKFYYKRWKSLFPMFYIAYFALYVLNVIKQRDFFYAGNPALLILSLIGMDGYFIELGPNYYILGEWFLGAIIILYVVYPLLLWLFKKCDWGITIILIGAFLFQAHTDMFLIDGFTNIISCLLSFEIGMLIMKYVLWEKKWFVVLSGVIMLIMACIPVGLNRNVVAHIMGIGVFFLLFYIGKLMRIGIVDKVITAISSLSYPIFLLQHFVVWFVLSRYNPVEWWKVLAVEIGIVIIVVIGAFVLNYVSKCILKSKLFLKFESKLGC